MLNLSDKDLDRLSKEAAQEYEPGEILGPNSWEKLEIRLDSDLGRGSPNPFRHIRRFPFYYAPVLLVLLGISYYYLTKHPPSPQAIVKNPITNQTQINPANSTPSDHRSASPAETATTTAGAPATAPADVPAGAPAGAPAVDANRGSAPATAGTATASGKETGASASSNDRLSAKDPLSTKSHLFSSTRPSSGDRLSSGARASSGNRLSSGTRASSRHSPSSRNRNALNNQNTHGRPASGPTRSSGNGLTSTRDAQTTLSTPFGMLRPSAPPSHDLTRSATGSLSATKTPADISDSALRAFTLKSMPPAPIKRALYIKRDWQFGLLAAPDFTSVNALAADKPGSTIGLTVDYQFAPRWYISSGLLFDRRNYAARNSDFHPTASFYRANHITDSQNLNFVKGSLNMLEIPLNLRYDFSITGSTLFFANVGVSSYLFASDNGNCYVHDAWFTRVYAEGYKNPNPGNYLFASMNLSLGVETGLSNSMSLLIAPYLKMPLRNIGAGQLQTNSVGISFSVKWAPITSMRRR